MYYKWNVCGNRTDITNFSSFYSYLHSIYNTQAVKQIVVIATVVAWNYIGENISTITTLKYFSLTF